MYSEEVLRDFLLDAGMVSRGHLNSLGGESLSRELVEQGLLSEDGVRKAIAHSHGIPFVELEKDDFSLDALSAVPEPLSREISAVGYRMSEKGLEVALLDLSSLDNLEFLRARFRILPRLTDRDSIKRALFVYQKHLREKYGKALEEEKDPARMARHLLSHALSQNASTARLEIADSGVLVRYRIGGAMRDAMMLPPRAREMLEKVFTKNGSMEADLGGGFEARLRVERLTGQGLPHGVTLHLRGPALESLGLHGEALEVLEGALARRRGLVAICGEGKSALLQAVKKVVSAPDAAVAELLTPGVNSSAPLRAALKTDPDIVLIDSIRDSGGAALASSGAARGILVVAVLDSGATSEEEKTFLPELAINQKLARKLCQKQFLEKRPLSRREQDALLPHADFARVLSALKEEGAIPAGTAWKDVAFSHAVPCSECLGGYTGSIGLQEVFAPDAPLSLNLIEDGLFKSAQGLTSVEEVLSMLYDGRE